MSLKNQMERDIKLEENIPKPLFAVANKEIIQKAIDLRKEDNDYVFIGKELNISPGLAQRIVEQTLDKEKICFPNRTYPR